MNITEGNQKILSNSGFSAIVLLALCAGAFGGYYFTNAHYREKEVEKQAEDRSNLVCRAEIGKINKPRKETKSDYYIFEYYGVKNGCENFIEYKNIPGDTTTFSTGL